MISRSFAKAGRFASRVSASSQQAIPGQEFLEESGDEFLPRRTLVDARRSFKNDRAQVREKPMVFTIVEIENRRSFVIHSEVPEVEVRVNEAEVLWQARQST